MRTIIVILIGFGILALMLIISYTARKKTSHSFDAPKLFILLWLIFVVIDTIIWMVVGYPILDELMIHSLIFIFPALAAWLLMKRRS